MSLTLKVFKFNGPSKDGRRHRRGTYLFLTKRDAFAARGAINQLLNINLQLRILVLLLVSTLPYVVKVKNYSYIGE
jgi:hypothetical protein